MNEAAQVDWLTGIVVLVVGGIIGVAVYWWSTRRKIDSAAARETAPPLEVRDLDAKRDILIQRLRELEDLSSTRTAEQLANERYALEIEAAETLRLLQKEQKKLSPAAGVAAAAVPVAPASGGMAGFLWGAGSMAAIAALIFFVSSASNDRETGMTGGEAMGAAQQQGEMPHPEITALVQRVEQNPEDLEARVDLAQAYLISDDLMSTFEQTQFVLQRDPQNPRALSYEAIVRLAMGDSETALAQLDQAITKDPTLLDGWVHKVLVLASLGRMDEAEATIVEAEQRFPRHGQTFSALRNHINTQFGGSPAVAPATPAGDQPSIQSSAPPSAPGERVSGMLQLDPSIQGSVSFPAVVWVMARPAGSAEGAPIAVSRIIAHSFPMVFSLGPEHAMMGGSLVDPLRLDVRIDPDGNPETKDEGAPAASMDQVHLGVNDLKLVLR